MFLYFNTHKMSLVMSESRQEDVVIKFNRFSGC